MKKQLHPALVGGILFVVVCGIGFVLYMKTGGFGPETLTPQQNPMPKEAGAVMQKMQENLARQRERLSKQNAGAAGGATQNGRGGQ